MRHRLSSTAALLAVLAVATIAQAQWSPPLPPVFAPIFTTSVTEVIVAEGVTHQCDHWQDGAHGFMLQRCRGPNGYFSELYRNDTGGFYTFYDIDGQQVCYPAIIGPTPVPPPNFSPFQFITNTTYLNRTAYAFRVVVNRYIMEMIVDPASMVPLLTTDAMNVADALIGFTNGTAIPASTFAIPAACTTGAHGSTPDVSSVASAELRRGSLFGMSAFFASARRRLRNLVNAALVSKHAAVGPVRRQPFLGVPQLPVALDNSPFASPVRDQGSCGSCWAFSTAAVTELVVNYKTKTRSQFQAVTEWLSVQNLIDCVHGDLNGTKFFTKGCGGGNPLGGMLHIVNNGIVKEAQYPYMAVNGRFCNPPATSYRPLSGAYVLQKPSISMIAAAIMRHGAIVAIINELQGPAGDFEYSGGIYDNAACVPGLAHAVSVVGWGVDTNGATNSTTGIPYWIIKNSFGAQWGVGGYFRMVRGKNMCGIEQFAFVAVAA